MEGIIDSLNNDGKDVGGYINPENPLQGLFCDLLSCLGGGDHPKLPPGYKQKPMTGFLDIVEAFNDVSKLRNAGSGILCEVDSKEFDSKGNLKPAMKRIVELKASNESTNEKTDSLQSVSSLMSELHAQRLTSASTNSDQSIHTIPIPAENDTCGIQLTSDTFTECQSNDEPVKYPEEVKTPRENDATSDTFTECQSSEESVKYPEEVKTPRENDATSDTFTECQSNDEPVKYPEEVKTPRENDATSDTFTECQSSEEPVKYPEEVKMPRENDATSDTFTECQSSEEPVKYPEEVKTPRENDPISVEENSNHITACISGHKVDHDVTPFPNDDVDVSVVVNSGTNYEQNKINTKRVYANSRDIQQVGPPLTCSDSSFLNPMHREINVLEKQMSKYSEELSEIEQMLRDHFKSPDTAHQQQQERHPEPQTCENELHHQYLSYPTNMVQTLTDGMMRPSDALEIMYNMESDGSPYNPHNVQTPNYKSCTSFSSCQAQNQAVVNRFTNPTQDSIKRSPSFYMDCLNLNESGASDFSAHVMTSLGSHTHVHSEMSPPIPPPTTQQLEEHSAGEFTDCDDENFLQSELASEFKSAAEDIYEHNAGYHTVDEESDVQEFTDAKNLLMENQRKKKTRFIDNKTGTSSEDEHLWTSASGSEYGDV